jgi:hypothetical protein
VALVVEDSSGRVVPWREARTHITQRLPGAALWEARASAGAVTMHSRAQMDFDGNIEYTIALTASRATPVRDIRLEIPLADSVARFFMGMGRKGGVRPDTMTWRWDQTKNQDAAWIGDVNAGLQFTLKDQHYIRPLNTNFYTLRPLVMPTSWANGGQGGCRFAAAAGAYLVQCFSGARTIAAGDTLYFNLRLLLTPNGMPLISVSQ